MEDPEYPVLRTVDPTRALPLATRRWGYDKAGETRAGKLARSRWRAGAAPFDWLHA